jgi:hypothetical protein
MDMVLSIVLPKPAHARPMADMANLAVMSSADDVG